MVSHVRNTILGIALISAAAGTAWGQVPQPAPTAPGVDRPARDVAPPTSGMVEGTVKKVDSMAGTVRISTGLFGLFGKTLEVGPDTRISVDGRDSNLAGIREGAKVKASYETRNGRTVATNIEATPSEQRTSSRRTS